MALLIKNENSSSSLVSTFTYNGDLHYVRIKTNVPLILNGKTSTDFIVLIDRESNKYIDKSGYINDESEVIIEDIVFLSDLDIESLKTDKGIIKVENIYEEVAGLDIEDFIRKYNVKHSGGYSGYNASTIYYSNGYDAYIVDVLDLDFTESFDNPQHDYTIMGCLKINANQLEWLME